MNPMSADDASGSIRCRRPKKRGARAYPFAFFMPYWREILLIGLPVIVGLVVVPLPLLLAEGLAIALTVSISMFAIAYLVTCVMCINDGEGPPLRDLFFGETPGGIGVAFFILLYLVGYPFYWWVIHVNCMLGYPRKYLPWVAVQVYSILVILASVGVHVFRHDIS